MQPQRLGRVFAHQTNGLREGKGVALVVGDAKSGIQQAGGIIVGGENVQQAAGRQMVGGDVPRVRAAAYDIRRAHQNVHPVLARRLRCGDRGGKFGDDAAKLARFEHMFAGGVIVAGQRDIPFATDGGDALPVRLRPGRRQSHLLLFEFVHLFVGQVIFALIVVAVFAAVGILALAR